MLLVVAAVTSFLLATVLDQLAMTNLTAQVSQLGLMALLCAFFLLLLAGLVMLAKLIVASFWAYFSTRQRLERKLLFYASQYNRLNRLFYFKKARLLYISQQNRKRLLKKHDRPPITP
jgi:predicted neuraminidase